MNPAATSIAIIGAGFSGSLLAVQLLRRFLPDSRVLLIEKSAKFGSGLAYSTGNPNHLLNVRAGRMSAFADEPGHFTSWLRQSDAARKIVGADVGATTFVPRWLYGAYIQDLLGDEIWRSGTGSNLFLVPDEAAAIHEGPTGLTIEMLGGRRYTVDAAVLAVGNFPHADAAAHYHGNPWSPSALGGLAPAAPVLLIGTGLTMVDTVVSLLDQGHTGPIHAISRRGLLPHRHGEAPPHALASVDAATVTELLGRVRRETRDRGGAVPWRSVVDALRPFTPTLWQGFSSEQKARFLRHLRPWWDVHRHRMAPAVADVVDGAVASGQLIVRAARHQSMTVEPDGVRVELRPRGSERSETLSVARVIDCSGPQCDYARIDSPLVRSLLAQGLARPDPLGLGLDVTLDSAIVDRLGRATRPIFALGPVTRGVFWEITSVPDIREQCWRLAALLRTRLEWQAPASSEPQRSAASARARLASADRRLASRRA